MQAGARKLISVYPSFWILIIVVFALDYAEQFFTIFFSVTVHEISHIIAARYFGLGCSKIIFTPIGEIAIIENMDTKELYKKLLIVLAGPFVNIAIVVFCLLFFPKMEFLIYSNLVIAVFNLLPIYPLDGGKVFNYIFSNRIGVLNTNKIGFKLGKILGFFIFFMGMIQVIFFPYNISLLCMSIYLTKISKREYINATFQFYKNIMEDSVTEKFLPAKIFVANKKTPIKHIINQISYNRYCIVHIVENGEAIANVMQEKIVSFIKLQGINGNMEDIVCYSEIIKVR